MMRSDRGYFCLPEVDLSIPFLPGMISFVKKAVSYCRFNELKLTVRRAVAKELLEDHVVEKIFPDVDPLLADVLQYCGNFNEKRSIYGQHKYGQHKQLW